MRLKRTKILGYGRKSTSWYAHVKRARREADRLCKPVYFGYEMTNCDTSRQRAVRAVFFTGAAPPNTADIGAVNPRKCGKRRR